MPSNFLITGLLRTIILATAKDHGVVYGQDIINTMDNLGQPVSPGTVYPLLGSLVRQGLLRRAGTDMDPRRVCYKITNDGVAALGPVKGILTAFFGG